jgi:sugar-specific transcriptional regulator TrmB
MEQEERGIPETVKESLRNIGLTDYEISIYLSLVSEGPMDARKLSEVSGVPYSRIYNILSILEKDKSFILKEEESRPSKYHAISPDEALVIARQQLLKKYEEDSNRIIRELNPIYQEQKSPIKIALYIHRGKETCLNMILSLFKLAKNSISFVSPDLEFLTDCYEAIKKARARGVIDIQLLVEEKSLKDEDHKKILLNYKEIAEIRARDQIFGNAVVIDGGKDAFIILTQKFFEKTSYFGVVTDHVAFGPAATYYFSYLYDTAKKVKL